MAWNVTWCSNYSAIFHLNLPKHHTNACLENLVRDVLHEGSAPDRVSIPGPLVHESDALPTALRGPTENGACLYYKLPRSLWLRWAKKSKGQKLKTKKRRQPFLFVTRRPDLIHTPIKFHDVHMNVCRLTDGYHHDVIPFFQNGRIKHCVSSSVSRENMLCSRDIAIRKKFYRSLPALLAWMLI